MSDDGAPSAPGRAAIAQLIDLGSRGQWQELELQSGVLLTQYPDTGFLWKALGLALWNQRKEALPALRRAADLAPEDAEAHSNLGNALVESRQFEAAAASCLRAVALNPKFAVAHANLGNAWRGLNRLAEAQASYRQALHINPQSAEVHCNLGSVLRAQGHLEEAVASYQRALTLRPTLVAAHGGLANTFRDQGKLDAALASGRRAVELSPGQAETHVSLGNVQLDLGLVTDALESFGRAVQIQPDHVQAHSNAGHAFNALRQWTQAMASCQRALDINPDFAPAHNNLGNALRGIGRSAAAADSYGRAIAIDPAFAAAHGNLGLAWFDLGRPAEAVACSRRSLALNPGAANVHADLGQALLQVWDADAAVDAYGQATVLAPASADNHVGLGNALLDQGDWDAAAAAYRRAMTLEPDRADAHHGLACVYRLTDRPPDAEARCREALRCDPQLTAGHALLAELHADRGLFREAEHFLRQAASIEPAVATPWAGIPQLRRMTRDDVEWLDTARALLTTTLQPRQERSLRFALGKFHDDTADYELAFEHYQRANEIAKQHQRAYDRHAFDQQIDALIQSQGEQWFRESHPGAESSERPIIVVGMPRSGTTLIEQTLAAHPAVYGAGELPFWPRAANAHAQGASAGPHVPGVLGALARDYLTLLSSLSLDAQRVVDKLPGNYLHLGMIHAALPHARIIHARRHALDTCLSIYFHDFTAAHDYAHDLGDLAHQFAGYRRIMAHWQAYLPGTALLEIPYEGLVDDHEAWTRRLLSFVGLPWDEGCLHFHANESVVRTFSRWQVRQKIVKTSVARWRRYERHLGPLRHLEA